jgi:peptide/nickel transport system permease protein
MPESSLTRDNPADTVLAAPAELPGLKPDLGTAGADPTSSTGREALASASQARLVWWRFRRHRPALVSLVALLIIYLVALFAGFFAPMSADNDHPAYTFAPPQQLHIGHDGLYVNGFKTYVDPSTARRTFSTDTSKVIPVGLFVRAEPYKIAALIPSDIRLIGPKNPADPFFLLGSDSQGRDMASRIIYGSQISMTIGLVGVFISFVLGIILGGISGYFAGRTDTIIQRVIEFVMSLPTLPLWLGLSTAVPPNWGPVKTYLAITAILSLIGWTSLARVIRGRFLEIRDDDFVLAAELDGASRWRIITRHMVPLFASHIIASITLSVPGMILAETSLSFLGLGLRAPAVSWGVLLQDAQQIQAIAYHPWLLLPAAAVVVAVMALNFVGDGLRDAADPYG